MADQALTKKDFELAIGRQLTDQQYDALRMGVTMGLDGGGGATLPTSSKAMSPERQAVLRRLHWLQGGKPVPDTWSSQEAVAAQGQGAPADAAPAEAPKPGRAKPGAKASATGRADAPGGAPMDDRADPVPALQKVYAANGQGVKDWQHKAVRPGYGWVSVDNGNEPPSAFAPAEQMPNNGWEGGQAPDGSKVVLGQYAKPTPAPVELAPQVIPTTQITTPAGAPVEPSWKATPVAATGSGAISASAAQAKKDVADLEAQAALVNDPLAAAAAKGKADAEALQKDAAAVGVAPAPPKPPPPPYVGQWVSPKPKKKG